MALAVWLSRCFAKAEQVGLDRYAERFAHLALAQSIEQSAGMIL